MATDPTAELRAEVVRLVEAARTGDREAFDELVRRTYVDTYTLAMRLTANEEDARDVVQDSYLRAWKGIDRFRGDAQFSTWMYRITANAASTLVQKRRRRRVASLETVDEPIDVSLEGQPEAVAESTVGLEELAHAVQALPPKLRSVVVLKDVYGLSHDVIAEDLGISVAAAKVRLHRGRKRLRDTLFEEGGRSAHAV
jgi:RNA polymerase sigma-70 factor (ECF subfamily)